MEKRQADQMLLVLTAQTLQLLTRHGRRMSQEWKVSRCPIATLVLSDQLPLLHSSVALILTHLNFHQVHLQLYGLPRPSVRQPHPFPCPTIIDLPLSKNSTRPQLGPRCLLIFMETAWEDKRSLESQAGVNDLFLSLGVRPDCLPADLAMIQLATTDAPPLFLSFSSCHQ